jgi:phosphatidylglycerophosphate synthase
VVHAAADLRDLPRGSRLSSQRTEAYYCESYEAPLGRSDLKMHEIYLAILGHLPWWARALIVVRNFIVSFFGLHAEPAANVWKPEVKDRYIPGDRIVRFNLYTLDDNEIVAGRDDKHLDFRVSVMQVTENGAHKVVVSTLIFTRNLFGKIYLLFVLPLHRFGMRRLLAQAIALGRI